MGTGLGGKIAMVSGSEQGDRTGHQDMESRA
jgi:hypothetical protein